MDSRILLSVPYAHIAYFVLKYFIKKNFSDPKYPIHVLSELGNLVSFFFLFEKKEEH
jgi:hypothetical protein